MMYEYYSAITLRKYVCTLRVPTFNWLNANFWRNHWPSTNMKYMLKEGTTLTLQLSVYSNAQCAYKRWTNIIQFGQTKPLTKHNEKIASWQLQQLRWRNHKDLCSRIKLLVLTAIYQKKATVFKVTMSNFY